MTRKKSNVKALALAVTCAILAGGYSGLSPVYAETPVTITPAGTISGDTTSGYTFIGTEITISGSTIAGALDGINISKAYVEGTRTLKALNDDVATNSAATQANATSITNNTNKINNVDSKYEAITNNIKTDMSTQVSTINTKIDTKLDTSTFGAYTASNDAAVNELKNKTQNIRVDTDTMVTSSDATYIDGITHAGGVRLADKKVRAKELVLEEGSSQATLTREGLVALNSIVYDNNKINNDADGRPIIQAGNGSKVGGVTFDNKQITNVDSITVNETKPNQVKINSEGIVVGLNSTVIGSDGVYAGGHNYNDAKAAIDGIDGKIKGAGGKFGVDDQGNVTTTGNIQGQDITVNGKLNAKGDAVVSGDLSVAGKADFTKEATFSGGIKTDGIYEATADKGVTVDGVLLKDKGISAAGGAFTVDGASGNIVSKGTVSAADGKFTVDADGAVSAAGGNFGVDKDGNTTVGGKLEVADDTTLKGKLDVTGDTTLKGKLDVTGDATLQGNLSVAKNIKGQSLNIGTTGNEFTVDTLGNVNANGITTSDTTTNKIGGVTLSGSDINAKNLTLTGTLTAAKYNATDIEATNSIKVGATTMTNGKLDLGSNGTIDFGANELTDVQVGNINSVIQPGGIVKAADGSVIGGVTFSAKDITGVKDLTATGKVSAATITDGTASLSGGALTGLASVNIGGNTTIDNTGIKTNKLIVGSGLNATTIDEANGVVSAKGEIGAVKFTGAGKLENVTSIDGVSVAQNSGSAAGGLTFGGNAIIGATGIPFQSTGFKVDDDGDVEGKTFTTAADGTGNRSTLASGSLTIDANNTWTKDAGIIASNVKVGSNELKNDGLHVGTNTTVKDGELTVGAGNTWSMANGITASKAGINGVTIGETAGKAVFNNAGKATTIDGDTIQTGKITADELLIDKISLGKGGSSNITIDKDGHVQTKGDIKITDAAGNVMSKLSQDQAIFGNAADNQTTINNGKLKAKAKNTANQQAEFNFDENGLTVSGQNAAGATSSFGFNAANGIGTFTGQDNSTTAINGSAITSTNGGATGVLNGSNLTLTNGANSTALTAGGATFTGANGRSDATGVKNQTIIDGGIITTDTLNVQRIELGDKLVDSNGTPLGGNLSMDKQGNFSAAGGNFKVVGGTGADKGAFTNTVGNTTLQTDTNGASMNYAGTANSSISVADGKAEMTVGANAAVTATDGKVEIKGGTQTVTTTDAGTVFENSAHNTPFGGGSETKTTINGNEITTGKITTDQLVIKGNGSGDADGTGNGSIALGGDGSIKSNIKDTTTGIESTFETKADKIGSVITGGTVELRQELDANTGKITNKAGDMSTELDNNGFTVKQNGKTDVKIADGDVTVTNDKNTANPGQEVHLSDLGSLNNLDGELAARDEYQDNKTAVGAINAEAGIRREEVARLDNRIDDVNNRVDKVGAMAAAIASLKSIGYDPQAPSEFSIGLGQYKGETGVAMGFFHYPNKNFMINVSLSTAGGETMGGIGATWRFGHKSPQKLLEEQREAQARKELAAAEKYQAAAKLAKEAQERAEYAAKLARQAQVSADNAKAAADATQAKHFQ